MTSPARTAQPDWSHENAHGLSLAAAGEWGAAAQAFDRAADRLSSHTSAEPEAHEALSLVLGNLAVSRFHAGDVDEAIVHAQRACALREALAGDDVVAVARTRSDLAVMLATVGRRHEAGVLLARAIAAIERTAGDEDATLGPVLENAARVALLDGAPSDAEPLLLRLHGLLALHGEEVHAAEALLAQVAATRGTPARGDAVATPAFTPPSFTPVSLTPASNTPVVDAPRVATPVSVAAEAPAGDEVGTDDVESEDQPLRDAVRLTDALLRSTPTGAPIVRADATATDPWTGGAETEAEAQESVQQAADEEPVESAAPPVADDVHHAPQPDVLAAFDDDLELVPARVPEPVNASHPDSSPVPTPEPYAAATPDVSHTESTGGSSSILGFEVQYGVPLDAGPDPRAAAPAPGDASRDPSPDTFGELELIDAAPSEAHAVPAAQESPVAPAAPVSAPVTATSPERTVPVVMPTRDGGQPMVRNAGPDEREIEALRTRLSETADKGAPKRVPRVAGAGAAGSKKGAGAAIGGIVGIAVAAAAGWFLYRGGFF